MIDYAPLVASLRKEEGVERGVYKDSRGIFTIGVGFNIDPQHGGGLDDAEIDFILQHRLEGSAADAVKYPWFAALDAVRQYVVIDMIYNMGPMTFAQFHGAIHSIAIGDYPTAATQMLASLWAKQVGKRAARLARIMDSGVWES